LVVCLYAPESLPRGLSRLVAAGRLAVTIYALHALAMAWQADLDLYPSDGEFLLDEYMSELFLVGSIVVAFIWRHLVGRGPVEACVSTVSKAVVPDLRYGPDRTRHRAHPLHHASRARTRSLTGAD